MLRRGAGAAALGYWAGALASVVVDEHTTPRLTRFRGSAPVPATVSVIVPARDEASAIGHTLRCLAAQDHALLEIIAVDDCSTDGTLAEIRGVPGVRAIEGAGPPAGWLGKPWACAQGVEQATGRWLLFLDADVRLAPWALPAALRFAIDRGGGGATVFPRLEAMTIAERIVLPVAAVIMQTAVVPSWLARIRRSDVAVGVGGFLLIERGLYDRIGGHGAVRDEVVDDLALARLAKRHGAPLAWARGDDAVLLRPYPGWGGLWEAWRKNAAHAWRRSAALGLFGGSLLAGATWAPWLLARRHRSGLMALLLQLVVVRLEGRQMGAAPAYAATAPIGMAFLVAVGAVSAWDRLVRRRVRWRGRQLPV